MTRISSIVVLLSCFFALVSAVLSCELDQTHNGCRIDNGACTCAFGCKSDFRYASRRECEDALKGIAANICSRIPCQNGGSCNQITQSPGYKCRCEGTGYWGSRCQRQCPGPEDNQLTQFPYECIVI